MAVSDSPLSPMVGIGSASDGFYHSGTSLHIFGGNQSVRQWCLAQSDGSFLCVVERRWAATVISFEWDTW
jgi:hypothetical protein